MIYAYIGIPLLGLAGVGWGLWMLLAPESYLRYISYKGWMQGKPWRNAIPLRASSITITRYLGGITIPLSIIAAIYALIVISK